ncbi:hypothetical protein SHKM778_32190 [Streptomyces sp. KM77-8]|uniref:Uncharacterized protein n=1 Tax=Streptomyces haneummycinicus TaxID=3074435 RepID=A0AAT9HH56_9ACTN
MVHVVDAEDHGPLPAQGIDLCAELVDTREGTGLDAPGRKAGLSAVAQAGQQSAQRR